MKGYIKCLFKKGIRNISIPFLNLILIIILVLVFIPSCYRTQSDFNIENINSNILPINKTEIGNPFDIFIEDSLLILVDHYKGNFLSIFNKGNYNLIGRYLSDSTYNSVFQMRKLGEGKFVFSDIVANNHYLLYLKNDDGNIKAIISIIDINNIEDIFSPIIIDNSIIGIGLYDQGKYIYCQGRLIKYYGNYPIDSSSLNIYHTNSIKHTVYQGQINLKPDFSKFVYTTFTDHFEIVNISNNQLTIQHTKNQSEFPEYKILESKKSTALSKANKLFFSTCKTNNDYIWILNLNGKTRKENGNNSMYGKLINRYNWDGDLNTKFVLDRSVLAFSLDSHWSIKIFAISKNENTYIPEIISFNL